MKRVCSSHLPGPLRPLLHHILFLPLWAFAIAKYYATLQFGMLHSFISSASQNVLKLLTGI